MYFHSASYSHEQYNALRAAAHRNKAKSKRTSLSSHTSGVDSGYTSSASSSPNSTQPSPLSRRVTEDAHHGSSMATPTARSIAPPRPSQKKPSYTRPSHPASHPRRPDVVYSSPRPMAFPFHNDAIFLPVAEADPRDVARVAPATYRKPPSLQSSKASSLTSASCDQPSAYRSIRSKSSASQHTTDTDTLRSRRSSILSNMQRGTVRSLRSLFQIPSHSTEGKPSERLPRLEIRNGTVQSLRELFNRPASAPTSRGHGYHGHSHDSVLSASSRASFSSESSLLSHKKLPPTPPVHRAAASDPKASRLSSLFSWTDRSTPKKPKNTAPATHATPPRISKLASLLSLPKPPSTPPQSEPVTTGGLPATPLPEPPVTKPKGTLSNLKKFSQMFTRSSSSSPTTDRPLPPTPSPASPPPAPSTPRRSLFSAFRRSDTPSPDPLQKKPDDRTEEVVVESEPTVMGRLWKGFKRMVTGKKISRVGIM